MKKAVVESEEKNILESYERGEWQTVKDAKAEAQKLGHYARTTIKKDRRISIRMSSKDLNQVQVIAAQEGIPYQTLISSVIHKYVNGSLVDKKREMRKQ
jgi:predicted DNA binding CopG/RHH family protein